MRRDLLANRRLSYPRQLRPLTVDPGGVLFQEFVDYGRRSFDAPYPCFREAFEYEVPSWRPRWPGAEVRRNRLPVASSSKVDVAPSKETVVRLLVYVLFPHPQAHHLVYSDLNHLVSAEPFLQQHLLVLCLLNLIVSFWNAPRHECPLCLHALC